MCKELYKGNIYHFNIDLEWYASIPPGWFANIDIRSRQNNPWHGCRETFQDYHNSFCYMFFSHPAHKGPCIAAFIHKVEKKLKLKTFSTFGGVDKVVGLWGDHNTNKTTISWIKVSPWWSKSSMRKSLFTALLRVGKNYNIEENNFDEVLNSHRYLRETQAAVSRFLRGYNVYKGDYYYGCYWYRQFKNVKARSKKLCGLLVKP